MEAKGGSEWDRAKGEEKVRVKCPTRGFNLILALVLSIAFLTAPIYSVEIPEKWWPIEVIVDNVVVYRHQYPPLGNAGIVQGRTFIIRHLLKWDGPEYPGYYAISISWYCYENNPNENLTFLNAKAYFTSGPHVGEPIENNVTFLEAQMGEHTKYGLGVACPSGDLRDGNFNVDVVMQASGSGGVPHILGYHTIFYGVLEVRESKDSRWEVNPIVIEVLPAVEVGISPSYREGPPGDALEYVIIVANRGETTDSYALAVNDNAGWNPTLSENLLENVGLSENRVITLSVTIPENASSGTEDEIIVTATSMEHTEVRDNDVCIAKALIVRDVGVSISPESKSGPPGETLTYTLTVMNKGNVADNYELVISESADPRWNPTLSDNLVDNRLENVQPGENRIYTLSVTVPENATSFAEDNITVTATSVEYAWVSDNASCVARVQGRAEFDLATLYKVSLDADLYLGSGSKLVVKFYTYGYAFEGESMFENFASPAHVVKFENIDHPENIVVEKARLDLTTDNTDNVISTLASFTVTQSHLMKMIVEKDMR